MHVMYALKGAGSMTFAQAFLLSIYFWFAKSSIFYSTVYIFKNTLFCGFICGLIMGNMSISLRLAAIFQITFLPYHGAGSSVIWDECSLSLTFCSYGVFYTNLGYDYYSLLSNLPVYIVPIGLFIPTLDILRRFFMMYPLEKSIQKAKQGKINSLFKMAFWIPLLFNLILYPIPMFVSLKYGPDLFKPLVMQFPIWILNLLETVALSLPALGIACALARFDCWKYIPFF